MRAIKSSPLLSRAAATLRGHFAGHCHRKLTAFPLDGFSAPAHALARNHKSPPGLIVSASRGCGAAESGHHSSPPWAPPGQLHGGPSQRRHPSLMRASRLATSRQRLGSGVTRSAWSGSPAQAQPGAQRRSRLGEDRPSSAYCPCRRGRNSGGAGKDSPSRASGPGRCRPTLDCRFENFNRILRFPVTSMTVGVRDPPCPGRDVRRGNRGQRGGTFMKIL